MPAGAATCAEAGSAPYLHTCGTQIVDANGNPVVLHALNWYGGETNDFVVGGLKYQSYQAIIDRIVGLGYNALRIPFSNELVERDPIVSSLGPICVGTSCLPTTGSDLLGPNSDLYGRDALSILKTIVDYAGQRGLYVILDNHRSRAAWGVEESGLWYTDPSCAPDAAPYSCFTPQSWLNDWQTVGSLFKDDPAVIGMDLRNEPHSLFQPSTCSDYLSLAGSLNGAHWGPCGNQNNSATDWPAAATQAGNLLLGLNPHWLMFVEGVSSYPQGDGSFSHDGWGENLQGVTTDPIQFNVPNRLVYSPHDYRWDQTNDTVEDMYATWTRAFGFIGTPGQSYSAPLWVGEYGTCTTSNSCIVDGANGNSAGWWFSNLVNYMNNPPDGISGPLSWSYWAVNGTYTDAWLYNSSAPYWRDCYGVRETYGLLGGDWYTLSAPLLQSLLIQPSATATPSASATVPATLSATATFSATVTATATATSGLTPAATVSSTVMVSASATSSASATATLTGTVTSTASATSSPTPTATATSSPTASPTSAAATPTAIPTPQQWPSVTCQPYTLTSTPTATPVPSTATPTATATNTALPTATPTSTATPRPTATNTPRPTATPTARPKLKPRPRPKPKPKKPAPWIAVHGSALKRAILLDLELIRDKRGRISGTMTYSDRHKRLSVHAVTWRVARLTCGNSKTALVTMRLRDKSKTYDATLRLGLSKQRSLRFTMQVGRIYQVSAALTGRVTLACPAAPPPKHKATPKKK